GVVEESNHADFKVGDKVIATSYEIGVSHNGGFSEYARVSSDWVLPLPDGLSLKQAMIYGTAGFTAALAVHQLQYNGVTTKDGKVLVSGATGGVGSIAVAMLAKLGCDRVGSTANETARDFLRSLGAS